MDQAQHLRNVIKAQNVHNIENTKIITITSGKGGVGKSNTAVNLAACFTRMGKKVIILDADFGLANVEVMFGTVPGRNLSDVIFGGVSIRDVITKGPMNIGFISGGSGVVGLNNLNKEQITFLVHNLSMLNDLCDILIIDTGAGVSDQVMDFVLASPEVVLVSTPEPSSLTDSYALLKAMYKRPEFNREASNVHLLANKVSGQAEGNALFDKMQSVVQKFLGGELEYLGYIPSDSTLEKAVRNQKVVSMEYPQAKSSKAYERIAGRLIDNKDMTHYKWGISQLFNNLLRDKIYS